MVCPDRQSEYGAMRLGAKPLAGESLPGWLARLVLRLLACNAKVAQHPIVQSLQKPALPGLLQFEPELAPALSVGYRAKTPKDARKPRRQLVRFKTAREIRGSARFAAARHVSSP
jgi:hypothetical protein